MNVCFTNLWDVLTSYLFPVQIISRQDILSRQPEVNRMLILVYLKNPFLWFAIAKKKIIKNNINKKSFTPTHLIPPLPLRPSPCCEQVSALTQQPTHRKPDLYLHPLHVYNVALFLAYSRDPTNACWNCWINLPSSNNNPPSYIAVSHSKQPGPAGSNRWREFI